MVTSRARSVAASSSTTTNTTGYDSWSFVAASSDRDAIRSSSSLIKATAPMVPLTRCSQESGECSDPACGNHLSQSQRCTGAELVMAATTTSAGEWRPTICVTIAAASGTEAADGPLTPIPPQSRREAITGTRSTVAYWPATSFSSRHNSGVVLFDEGSFTVFREGCLPSPSRSCRNDSCSRRRVHVSGVRRWTASTISSSDGCSRRRSMRSRSPAYWSCTARSLSADRKSAVPRSNAFFPATRFS